MTFARSTIILLASLMLFAGSLRSATPEEEFWKWFVEHEAELVEFERDQEAVFDRLSAALARVDPALTFEFGPKRDDGRREFVISADGVREVFPKVESLFAAAPKLDRWIVVKFRQRHLPLNDLVFGGKRVRAEEVRYLLFKDDDPQKIGVLLIIPGYVKGNEDDAFAHIGYLFLDQALGEYDVETKVGAIVFDDSNSKYLKDTSPLTELPAAFDEHFQRSK